MRNLKYKVERRYTIVFPALLHCQPPSIFGGESERENTNSAGAVRVSRVDAKRGIWKGSDNLAECETRRKTFERDWRKSSYEKGLCGALRTYDNTAGIQYQ